jgi:hypothetical protein
LPFVGNSKNSSDDSFENLFGYIFGSESYVDGVSITQYYDRNNMGSGRWIEYYIPAYLKSVTITGGEILSGAFSNCEGLVNITIPDSATSIGGEAFYGCKSLTNITIPDGVTSIGNRAFEDCRSLMSVTIPKGVTTIGDSTFEDCRSLMSVTIPKGVTTIGDRAFETCSSLTDVTIPNSVTSIGSYAFMGCGLTNITIPTSVTFIGKSAFYGCSSLTSVVFVKGDSGWWQSNDSSFNYMTSALLDDQLSDAETAAIYLTQTYKNSYWKRMES